MYPTMSWYSILILTPLCVPEEAISNSPVHYPPLGTEWILTIPRFESLLPSSSSSYTPFLLGPIQLSDIRFNCRVLY